MKMLFKKAGILTLILLGLSVEIGGILPHRVLAADTWTAPTTGCYSLSTHQIQGNPPLDKAGCDRLIASKANVEWFTQGTGPQPTDACTVSGPVGSPEYQKCIDELAAGGNKQATSVDNVNDAGWWVTMLLKFVANFINSVVLRFVALITGLAGGLLNGIVFYTVVKMKENYDKLTPILSAWQTLRDIANMSFIFVLLYAGIRTILGQEENNKQVIVNVVVAAVLLNFSMFLTRIVIDMANVFSLVFYDAVAPSSLMKDGTFNWTGGGLSTQFARALGIQTFFSIKTTVTDLNFGTIIMTGLMGSIMLLVAAFVFTAAAILFLIRYVVLLLVIVLSPVFFVALALPKGAGMKKYQDQWKDALFGQAFFAPIYFFFIWLSLRILSGVMGALNSDGQGLSAAGLSGLANGDTANSNLSGAILMLMNYGIVIILLITALVQAKEWADKAGGGMKKLTSWAQGAAGGATLGLAGKFGRQTIGRGMQELGESEALKEARARMIKRGGITGALGAAGVKFTQTNLQKGGSRSFDVRGSGFGAQLDAGKAQKGGFEAYRKEQAKNAEDYAKSQDPSDQAKARAERARDVANQQLQRADIELRNKNLTEAQRAVVMQQVKDATERKNRADNLLGNKDEIGSAVKAVEQQKQRDVEAEKAKNAEEIRSAELAEKSAQDMVNKLEAEAEAALAGPEKERRMAQVAAMKENLKNAQVASRAIRKANEVAIKEITSSYDKHVERVKKQEIPGIGERRKAAEADAVEKSKIAMVGGYNYAAAAKIRKGKSAQQEAADALKKLAEADGIKVGEPKPQAPPTAGESTPAP